MYFCEGAACVNLKEACTPSFHKEVPFSECRLHHSGHLHDRLSHFFQEWSNVFEKADAILIEKQPFHSAGYPFELIMREKSWGSKCIFVPPTKLLSYFGTSKLSYDDRKEANECIARDWLIMKGCSALWAQLTTLHRRHDCADAILLIIYHLEESNKPNPQKKTLKNDVTFCKSHVLEQFRYKSKK